jgi:hypothetical protein
VAVDANGNLFITDLGYNAVREIAQVDGFSTVSTPGPGLNLPLAVAMEANDDLFVADTDNNAVKEISQAGGNFGSANVGSGSPTTISMYFVFDAATTLGSTAVLTQGAASLDFSDAGTGTCKPNTTYAAGDNCTVDVDFTPSQPGMRFGNVELLDGSANLLATGTVQGIGVSPTTTPTQ